jgi:Fe-S-cluster-containing dehydrogenase component
MKVFVMDMAKCNGCYGCQLACKDEHVGNDWMPYAKPQPDTGHFWLKVKETTHGQTPRVRVEYLPVGCMHCDDAPCIRAGGGAVYKREDGLVIIDPAKAQGRQDLVEACPYQAIYWNEELRLPQKCTGCAQLVEQGQLPHCVDLCAVGALRFGEEADFAAEIAGAEVLSPELGTKPRFYYLNRPGFFLGGDVWDQTADEIIEGAQVTLSAPSELTLTTETDDFGDFWFRKLVPGQYTLTVAAAGYVAQSREINLTESLNVGDFPLLKS